MLREVAVAALRIATGLHSPSATGLHGLARLVKAEVKKGVSFAALSSHALQEASHFRLRKEKYLRRPPSAKLSTLGFVYCGIEPNQAKEIGFRRAPKIVEPRAVTKWFLGSSRGRRLWVGSR